MTRTPEDFARLYDSRQSIRAVAAATGTSYTHARRQLRTAGVQFRTPGPSDVTLALADDCARLYRRLRSIRAVADRVGHCYSYTRDLIVLGGAVLLGHDGEYRKAGA